MEKIKKFLNLKYPSFVLYFLVSLVSIFHVVGLLFADYGSANCDFHLGMLCLMLFFLFVGLFMDRHFLGMSSEIAESAIEDMREIATSNRNLAKYYKERSQDLQAKLERLESQTGQTP